MKQLILIIVLLGFSGCTDQHWKSIAEGMARARQNNSNLMNQAMMQEYQRSTQLGLSNPIFVNGPNGGNAVCYQMGNTLNCY